VGAEVLVAVVAVEPPRHAADVVAPVLDAAADRGDGGRAHGGHHVDALVGPARRPGGAEAVHERDRPLDRAQEATGSGLRFLRRRLRRGRGRGGRRWGRGGRRRRRRWRRGRRRGRGRGGLARKVVDPRSDHAEVAPRRDQRPGVDVGFSILAVATGVRGDQDCPQQYEERRQNEESAHGAGTLSNALQTLRFDDA
jgi:hypothetical protein